MNIDFPPPSNGIYNNAGSSRQLANYLEHEDVERMQKGIHTEGFFNLTKDNLYKSEVIKDIDGNIAQLLKTDAKFYAIHVSPSEKELKTMGKTEQEKNDAMKRYIREVFIPEYAKNFNKGLSAEDIKFYGKIHFDRNRSDNELNMHCHLIVSRKDQSNKKKISPLTNHKNTKKGAIKGGFNRTNLFQQAEKGFDKLFGYPRVLQEIFIYCNTMKNGNIIDKLQMQEKEIVATEVKKNTIDTTKQASGPEISKSVQQQISTSVSQSNSLGGISSLISIIPSGGDMSSNTHDENDQKLWKRKKKKKRRRII